MDNEKLITPRFKSVSEKNEKKSAEAGRAIFDDREIVEIRTAADRQTVGVYPAHAFSRWIIDENGNQVKQTYAERFSKQYRQFKENKQQTVDGTPLSELPFLSEAKRAELRALGILTAETLAALDGPNLKTLGQGGREMKNQAQAWIDNASGTAVVVRMAKEIEELKAAMAAMQGVGGGEEPFSHFKSWDVDQIKDWIEQTTGERPKGNPNHATLVKKADEIASRQEVEAA